eukprot:TRINITY_DN5792_c0_g1_i5.p1 TRINITY_DN5792_c0_g1~~TRINITY_DN5792_c0_g1_i5.p1  ORF type:complete len:544 (+),score=110.27 TRINITY_DN5792_c0_g1_i5:45-1634(+)
MSLKNDLAKSLGGAPKEGYNAVIVCCSGVIEANYWQQRLESSRGVVVQEDTLVVSVDEDWNGGAGNGLGTLYAFSKAQTKALEKGVDLQKKMASGEFSVAVYHTAGKGTRLAPLPGAENNNKPGVKLPSTVALKDNSTAPITILEAVIKQTSCYAASRKGRLSVFWGDQIFIPSISPAYKPTAHIDLLAQMLSELPTAEIWEKKGLSSYGLAVEFTSGEGAQIEKVDHPTATRMLASLGDIKSVGPSLGSFSISSAMLEALLKEFSGELKAREGQLDTDPHFWMPLTLPVEAYCEVMGKKGWGEDQAKQHHKRLRGIMTDFNLNGLNVFGAVNAGEDAYWWDYGQLTFYYDNNMRFAQDGEENDAYRAFFNAVQGTPKDSNIASSCTIDAASCVASCTLHTGTVKASSLCNVTAGHIEADSCILVNVTAKSIKAAPGTIAYNVVDDSDEGLVLPAGKVITSVFAEDGSKITMQCQASVDGKDAWSKVLEGNPKSFEEVHAMNKGVDPTKCETAQKKAHANLATVIGSKM